MTDSDQLTAPPRPTATAEPRPARRPRQGEAGVLARLKANLQSLTFGNPLSDIGLGSAAEGLRTIPTDPWPGDARTGSDLVQNIYRFAGQTVQLAPLSWEPVGVSETFLYELHSFDWLRDLRSLGGDVARRQARILVRSWIERNGAWNPLAWDPVVLGRRLTNWLGLYDFFCATADDEFKALVLDSLKRQGRHLARALSSVPKGSGRVVALRGLFYAGICLPKGEAKLAYGLKLLPSELANQVLADGGHVSRSPSDQLEVLRCLIDTRAILRLGAQEVPEKLQFAIDRMTPALRFYRHTDGCLSLFNGSREGDGALIEAVLAQADAKGKPLKSMPHVGYERITAGRTCLLVDCGSPPPAGYDTKAFVGLLAFEMSVGRDRLIVNCGAHPMGTPSWRKALGCTAAHSTLTLHNTNATEVIDGGLGRRPQSVTCERQEEGGAIWLDMSHDGYDALYHTLHYRRLYVGDGGEDIRGEDTLEGPAGFDYSIRFHLHPSVQASLIQQGGAVLLATPSGAGWRLRATSGNLCLEESIYSGKGDEPRRTVQIVISGITTADSTVIKWALQREKRG